MMALTLWQPYASLVVYGRKRNETRSWHTEYTGDLGIHAAKKWDEEVLYYCTLPRIARALKELGLDHDALRSVCGHMLGIAELAPAVTTDSLAGGLFNENFRNSDEFHFGDYRPGRWAWPFQSVGRFEVPIPVRGAQGLWEWEPDGSQVERPQETKE